MEPRTTLFVGMNPTASYESESLQRAMQDHGCLKVVCPDGEDDRIQVGDTLYDLTTHAGRSDFIREHTRACDSDQAALMTLLENAEPHSHESVAQIILVYEAAERGDLSLERVVLSGHSEGTMLWGEGDKGEDNGCIPFQFFRDLAAIYPRAASQVQDIMFSSCNTGNQGDPIEYIEPRATGIEGKQDSAMFPNAQSIWAYNGTCPTSRFGAARHLVIWERLSRGDAPQNVDATKARQTTRAEHVTTWNVVDGHRDVRGRLVRR